MSISILQIKKNTFSHKKLANKIATVKAVSIRPGSYDQVTW